MRRERRRCVVIEVIRLCEREMEKVLGLRLSSCERANSDKGSMILNKYFRGVLCGSIYECINRL